MNLSQIIYASRFAKELGEDDFKSILESAQRNNHPLDITGYLAYGNNFFLQILEGDAIKINSTYQKIIQDSRHKDALMIDYSIISDRQFGRWHMGHCDLHKVPEDLLKLFGGIHQFDPYVINPEEALNFLVNIEQYLDNI